MLFRKLHILHKLHCSEILAVPVTNCHIPYKHRSAAIVHPYGNTVTAVIAEIVNDTSYHLFDLWRVAGEHLSVYRHSRTFEYLFSLVEKAVDVVRIDKGDLHSLSSS